MIRVCHMTSAHDSNDVRIFQKECVSLASAGYMVYLVAQGKSYVKDGVHIVGIGKQPKSRLKRMAGTARLVYKYAVELDAHIYHIHDPELLPYALKLKKIGKKVIYDVHEDYPLDIMIKQWIPKWFRHISSYIFEKYEMRIASNLDAIISVTPQIIDRFKKVNSNTILITNYPIIDEHCNSEYSSGNRKRQICFAGTISHSRMHHNIIDAIEQLKDVRYVLAGSNNGYLENLRKKTGFNKVDYLGRIPYDQVLKMYRNSQVGIVLENYDLSNYQKEGSLGVTKLFEYMMAKLPVICTDFTLHKAIIDKYECGICINPNNINEIADAINYLIENQDIATKMGENGIKAVVEKYNWNVEEVKLLELYQKLA